MRKKPKSRPKHAVSLCRIFEDIETRDFFWHLKFRCVTGETRDTVALRGTPTARAVDLLKRKGWVGTQLGTEAAYIDGVLKTPNRPTTKRTVVCGWHGDVYVYAGQTFGAEIDEIQRKKWDSNIDDALYVKSGLRIRWRNELRNPCSRSYYLCFGIGVAFAGPILNIINEGEGCLFNIQGESTSGKTLTGRVCQSVFGGVGTNDIITYAATERGLEEVCASRNDLALVLDELLQSGKSGQKLRDMMKTIAFRVAGGQSKTHASTVSGKGRELENLKWRLFGLTSSEATLDSLAGTDFRDGGEKVRHIDIPVPSTAEGGIFRVPKNSSGLALAQSAERAILQNHGVALKYYIEYLINNKNEIKEKVVGTIEEFYSTLCVSEDAWERRFARKFGIVLAAMQLAIEAGVAPWTSEIASKAVEVLYRRARKRATSDNIPFPNEIRGLQKLIIDKNCIPRLKEREAIPEKQKNTAVGFIRPNSEHGQLLYLSPEKLKEISQNTKQFITFCQEHGISPKGEDGTATIQVSVKGYKDSGRRRWYRFREQALRNLNPS